MTAKIISTLPKNDDSCGWLKQLTPRIAQPAFFGKIEMILAVIVSY